MRQQTSGGLPIGNIIAERISESLQIMMVPSSSKFFFANDVVHGMSVANQTTQTEPSDSQQR